MISKMFHEKDLRAKKNTIKTTKLTLSSRRMLKYWMAQNLEVEPRDKVATSLLYHCDQNI